MEEAFRQLLLCSLDEERGELTYKVCRIFLWCDGFHEKNHIFETRQDCTTCGLSSPANFFKILSSKCVCCFHDIRDKNAHLFEMRTEDRCLRTEN